MKRKKIIMVSRVIISNNPKGFMQTIFTHQPAFILMFIKNDTSFLCFHLLQVMTSRNTFYFGETLKTASINMTYQKLIL